MRVKIRGRYRILLAIGVFLGVFSTPVAAEVSSSKNYQVTDTEFGSTSLQQSCSSKYCATVSIGDMTPGEKAGVAQFRTYTTGHAHLQVIIEAGSSDLGTLSTEETATKTMVVKVQNYIGAGYVVQIVGTPPTFDTHVLKALTSPSASRAGHEQFGLNVVKNTLPNVGVDPSSDSSKTVLGAAAADYDTANLFQYHSGDVVARGTSASGETDYTVSMIVNISNLTPPGHYTSNLQAVVIPTY